MRRRRRSPETALETVFALLILAGLPWLVVAALHLMFGTVTPREGRSLDNRRGDPCGARSWRAAVRHGRRASPDGRRAGLDR